MFEKEVKQNQWRKDSSFKKLGQQCAMSVCKQMKLDIGFQNIYIPKSSFQGIIEIHVIFFKYRSLEDVEWNIWCTFRNEINTSYLRHHM